MELAAAKRPFLYFPLGHHFEHNGVNVEALLGAREAFADAPEIAQFQWRSTVSWVNGTHSRSDVETFFGFGEEQRHHDDVHLRHRPPAAVRRAGQRRSRRSSTCWSPWAAA